jgi:hypothetical protein
VRRFISLFAGAAAVAALSACNPFGLPATRALEGGARAMLDSAGYDVSGDYSAGGSAWTVDLQLARPDARHVVVTHDGVSLEAVLIGQNGYFRGHDFLAQKLSGNPLAPSLVAAAGNAWWKDTTTLVPSLPDLTDGTAFASTFLGSAVTSRTDNQPVGGVDAVELSGTRANVYIASAPPYRLLRLHLNKGVVIDGISDADLTYRAVAADFKIVAPSAVIDFANFSTLPPIYTVLLVDTSACGSPCTVSAKLKNLGGTAPAQAASTVSFTMADPASGRQVGSCQATVRPDVGYNSTTTVSCNIAGIPTNAAVVTAVATNPGRAAS